MVFIWYNKIMVEKYKVITLCGSARFGCVFLVLAIVTTCIFSYYTISFFTAPEGEELGSALGFILVFAYFFIPSLFFGIVAIILNVLAYKKAEKSKVAKLVCMILSIVLTSLDVLLYIIIRMM